MTDDAASAVKSAGRVLDLLELFAGGERLSHADIATALEIPKSSLTQLLRTLAARGYVDFDPASKRYGLGTVFARFSRRAGEMRDLADFVIPFLEDITRETEESCALNQLKGEESEVVATVNSAQRLLTAMRKGDVAPLYATSGGKVLLAHLPEAMRGGYVAKIVLTPITAKTIRSRRELLRQIAAIRREGFAYAFEEFTPGICGIAVPVLSVGGHPLGSLNVAMPALRFNPRTRERAARALAKAAARIQREFARAESPAGASRSATSRPPAAARAVRSR